MALPGPSSQSSPGPTTPSPQTAAAPVVATLDSLWVAEPEEELPPSPSSGGSEKQDRSAQGSSATRTRASMAEFEAITPGVES